MQIDKVIYGLNSNTRRKILKLLCKRDMTAPEIFKELKNGVPSYRQSVSKGLEILRECGLLIKYYDDEKKHLYYKITKKVITLRLDTISIIKG